MLGPGWESVRTVIPAFGWIDPLRHAYHAGTSCLHPQPQALLEPTCRQMPTPSLCHSTGQLAMCS